MRVHVDGKTYLFDQDEMDNLEVMDVEEVTGWGLATWGQKLDDGSGKAITALVWLCRKREEPELEFHQVRFKLGRFNIDRDDEATDEGDVEGKGEAPSPETSTTT